MRSLLLSIVALFGLVMCNNFDDAAPSDRKTFVKFYEGYYNTTASTIERIPGGYLLLGNNLVVLEDTSYTQALLIQIDEDGNRVGDLHYYENSTGRSIKPFSNGTFTGYIMLGDSIRIDPNDAIAGNIEIASTHIIAINENFEKVGQLTLTDTTQSIIKTDIRGSAFTTTADGRIILITTFEPAGSTVKPWIFAFNNDLTLDWEEPYPSIDKDYVNGKSVHYFNNKIIWATSILRQQGNFSDSYVAVPYLEEPLSFANYSTLGDNLTDKLFKANEIQPAKSTAFGFGVVGTYGETDESNQNLFFAKVNSVGTIVTSDTLFVDAVAGRTGPDLSNTEETGECLFGTSDGGFILAGTVLTATVAGTEIGNGARDIFLVKVNAAGDIVWTKIFGGTGDEVVSAVRETSDQGLIICGTNNLGNYSSIFVIKTDRNGELKN